MRPLVNWNVRARVFRFKYHTEIWRYIESVFTVVRNKRCTEVKYISKVSNKTKPHEAKELLEWYVNFYGNLSAI